MRINNRKLVLDVVRKSLDLTVAQLAEEIQLSKTTLWKIIDHFQEQNLIIHSGKAKSSDDGGKKPELYRFNDSYAYVISIAIYNSSILLALADARSFIFYQEKIYLNENEQLDRIIGVVSAFIKKWQDPSNLPIDRKDSNLIGIAIASAGVIDFDRGICFTASRFHSWPVDARIKEMITNQVELKAPFYIDNFNRYYAFAEKCLGGFEDKENIVDIVVARGGLGAGIIVEGDIKRGPHFLSGEIGHMRLDPYYKESCHCGGHGCFEQLVSSQKLLNRANQEKASHQDSLVYQESASEVTLQHIFQAADDGDEWGQELLDRVIEWFAIGILNITLVFNPEVIIISGDYRFAGSYFHEKLNNTIEELSLTRMKKKICVEYSRFGEEGALLGAASYAIHEYFSDKFDY